MNRLIAFELLIDRVFLWSDCFHTALVPHLQKTNHAADL